MDFTVFVSHAHEDAPLVGNLETLITSTLDDVTVRSSSSRPARGGIEPGTSWLDWIHTSVTQSNATIIVLTDASYDRPWLLWESGAVSGVSLAAVSDAAAAKPIIPVTYDLALDSIPAPLRHHQLTDAGTKEGIMDLLGTLYGRVGRPSSGKFRQLLGLEVPKYLRDVQEHLDERASIARSPSDSLSSPALRAPYDKTYQGEDLDLTVVNFVAHNDPDDMSGVTIVNNDGDWIIEIDVESPLRGARHAVDVRFRRDLPTARGLISFRVDSGDVAKHEEIIDLSRVRHEKYSVEYLMFRQISRIAKVVIRPLDDDARRARSFCLDSVSVYSLPHGRPPAV